MRTDIGHNGALVGWLRRITLWLIAYFVLTVVFDGVLRWAFAMARFPQLVYLRDVIPIIVLAAGSAIAFLQKDRPWLLGMSALLICGGLAGVWSVYSGTNLLQVLFAFKTILLLPAGAALWKVVEEDNDVCRKFSYFAFSCVILGLLVSSVTSPPWAGSGYQIGDLEIEGQRQWTIDSVDRIGGFSRASFDAASQLAFLAAVILTSRAAWFVKSAFAIVALAGIAATTSRSVALGLFIAIAAHLAIQLLRGGRLRWVLLPLPLLSVVVYFVATAFPSALSIVASADRDGIASTRSFLTRSDEVWLEAVSRVHGIEAWLLGLGLGNIGAAQKLFVPIEYNPADNLFVYCVVSFGVIGCVVFYGLLLLVWARASDFRANTRYGLMIVLVGAAGATLSALESSMLAMGVGLAFGEFFSGCRLPSKRRGPSIRQGLIQRKPKIMRPESASLKAEHKTHVQEER